MIDQKEQAFCLQLEDSQLAHALGSAPGVRSKGLDELHRVVVQLHPHPFNIIRREVEIKQAVPQAFAAAYMWVLYVVTSSGKLMIDVCVCVCVCVCVRARARDSGLFKTVGGLLVRAYPTRSNCIKTKEK